MQEISKRVPFLFFALLVCTFLATNRIVGRGRGGNPEPDRGILHIIACFQKIFCQIGNGRLVISNSGATATGVCRLIMSRGGHRFPGQRWRLSCLAGSTARIACLAGKPLQVTPDPATVHLLNTISATALIKSRKRDFIDCF